MNPQQIDELLTVRSENEHLEFKKAENHYDFEELVGYCVALANEGGGRIVLGVTDKPPRKVVGTAAFNVPERTVAGIHERLHLKITFHEVSHDDGRVLVFNVPSRPTGQPVHYKGRYLMRAGEELVAMSPDELKRIFSEGQPSWLEEIAKEGVSPDEVVSLLDTQTYFDLLKVPYPTTRDAVIERLKGEGFISYVAGGWSITNLAAILLAKRLDAFTQAVARKAARFVVYDGVNKTKTKTDMPGTRGYAVGFESLVDFVHSAAPKNEYLEVAIREEVKMFPKQALRELIANALVHQDFATSGTSVMIEMYDDRIEVSNPGTPAISPTRFIDEYRSRNERLADVMRRLGICEEKGSGIDKVVSAAEVFQLPAPDFRVGEIRTNSIMFSHQDFADMSKADRVRACYQHCVLQYLSAKRMSNQSLRERFGLPESKSATVSLVLGAAKDDGLIKLDESDSTSTRYARYLPFWG